MIWLWLIFPLLSFQDSARAQQSQHSPLQAFKQLGFDSAGNGRRQQAIPYSISDFSESEANSKSPSSTSAGTSTFLTQMRHPNDILSNMGVDLPSEEILGKPNPLWKLFYASLCIGARNRIANWNCTVYLALLNPVSPLTPQNYDLWFLNEATPGFFTHPIKY